MSQHIDDIETRVFTVKLRLPSDVDRRHILYVMQDAAVVLWEPTLDKLTDDAPDEGSDEKQTMDDVLDAISVSVTE